MKKAKNLIKNNIKLLIGIIIGIIISAGGVYAAVVIQGTSVGYTDNNGLGATTVQAAIDALYNKTKIGTNKYIEAYTYSTTTATKCITGAESTCVATTCYKTKSASSCPAGTIIKYAVNSQEVYTFHVMYNDASTITMQSQRCLLSSKWASSSNTSGPGGALQPLEEMASKWDNVNEQKYTMGTTVFQTNAYTGCNRYNNCYMNKYTMTKNGKKARMITVQEAAALGCTETANSCPIWLYNYLYYSTSNGGSGTINEEIYSNYWTMNAYSGNTTHAWTIYDIGALKSWSGREDHTVTATKCIRPVVVVSK